MRNQLAFVAALLTTAAPALAAVIETGAYEPGLTTRTGGLNLGPGSYRFDLRLTTPVLNVFGYPEKITTTNFVCFDPDIRPDEFFCGGDNVPTQPLFEQVTPTLWRAFLTVDPPSVTTYPPGGFFVRDETFDECCTYIFDIESEAPGRFVFSYAAVPEPASWALMVTAFGLAGAAFRRRTVLATV